MQDERSRTPADDEDRVDFAVLHLLLHSGSPGLWAVDEVATEVGDRLAVVDAIARLKGAGLIHECGEFVFASRAAIRFCEIAV
jgi:hypothetical protein